MRISGRRQISNFKRAVRTALALSCCFVAVACTTVNPKNKHAAFIKLQEGLQFLGKEDYPAALRALTEAEKLDPQSYMIENDLGLLYFLRNHPQEAEDHLTRSIAIKSDYTEARNNLARIHLELGRFDQALKELQGVLADLTYPTPEKAYFNIGLVYFRKGDFEKAKLNFVQAIKQNRRFCPAHSFYGQSEYQLKEYQKATDVFDNGMIVCPDLSDEFRYHGALAYFRLGKSEQAIARMEELIKLNPESPNAEKAKAMLKIMK